jgi:hypothetical protein
MEEGVNPRGGLAHAEREEPAILNAPVSAGGTEARMPPGTPEQRESGVAAGQRLASRPRRTVTEGEDADPLALAPLATATQSLSRVRLLT